MNERIHNALDGDPNTRATLNANEAGQLAEAEQLMRSVVQSIPGERLPDLAPAVMQRIAAARHQRPAAPAMNMRAWLWSPRPVQLQWRPAYAIAALAMIALFAVLRPAAAPIGPATQEVLVQFRLDAPNAHQVQLAGNFTNWQTTVALKRTGAGVWTVVVPLTPGVHNYAFVVDGQEWVADPTAQAVSDGFGGVNSQLAVLSPDQGRSL